MNIYLPSLIAFLTASAWYDRPILFEKLVFMLSQFSIGNTNFSPFDRISSVGHQRLEGILMINKIFLYLIKF